MFGQGGPTLPILFLPLVRRTAAPTSFLCCIATLGFGVGILVCASSSAFGETLGLRISWGGGAPRRWSGTITVSEGQIVSWTLLGTEVDEPGALFREENTLVIAPSRPRIYQGVDVVVDSPIQANLQVELAGSEQAPQHWTIPLKNVLRNPYETPVDDQGNRLFVERSPGDVLTLESDRPHLIFEPGETWSFRVRFRGSPFNPGEQVTLEVRVQNAREQQTRWNLLDPFNLGRSNAPGLPSARYETTAGSNVAVPVELVLPEAEGVYDVVLTAVGNTGLRLGDSVVRPLGWGGTTVQRRVQVVVLAKKNVPSLAEARSELRLLGEAVDAGNPTFWERLGRMTPALPRLHLLSRDGLLGRGWRRLREGQQEPYTELRPSDSGDEPSWAIYSLPVMEPGTPHLLEIEWPADRKQTLLVSLIEPNAMGAISPPLMDRGVTSSGEVSRWGEKLGWQVYRTVFWPKTRQPFLMVANPGNEPAIYGKIRVYGGWRHLPEEFPPAAFPTERILAAYFHRPFLTAAFEASDAPGPFRERGVEDWVTFFDATVRLSEYLRFAGYNAVVLTVAADGSTLFPSPRWQPTPRYDNGCFHPDGADPVRKDVVELVLRIADRDGFLVIPAMDFSAPLPDLEATIHRRGNQGRNLRWVGPDGRTLDETTQPYRGMLAYYNILHREVQETILNLIHEFADRYGQHPSFAGLGLQVSAYGYMQLPGPQWGMDDETVARFCEETGITIEATGEDRFQKRAELLLGQYFRQWVRWRAQRLQSFYTRVNQELTAVRPDARLYLLAPTLFVGERWENRLRPTLMQRQDPLAVFQEVGLDPSVLASDPSITFLRVFRLVEHAPLGVRAAEYEVDQLFRSWQGLTSLATGGVLFYQAPREIRIPSFDAAAPYSPAFTAIMHQPIPWGYESLRRYAQALAEGDPSFIADGGWRVSMGDEEALRVWRATYRRLPAAAFHDVSFPGNSKSIQPLIVRSAVRGQETYLYMLNQAGFSIRATLHFQTPANTRVVELSGMRPLPTIKKDTDDMWRWEADLGPYDLLAVKFTSPQVSFSKAMVYFNPAIIDRLKDQITELSERAATLSTPPLYEGLANPDFEQKPEKEGEIPHWKIQAGADATVRLDDQEKKQGTYSLHVASRGAPVTMISDPFEAPSTGRLTVGLWLKTRPGNPQPPLRVFLFGEPAQFPFARYAEIGASATGQSVPTVGAEWTPVLVQVADLPLGRKGPLYLRLDLAGPGEVWIDDIQLCSLAFSKAERVELFKLIAPAQAKLDNGEIADCLRMLESYWPQYLMAFVPRADLSAQISRENQGVQPSEAGSVRNSVKTPDRSASLLDRIRGVLPSKWRF